MEERAMGWKEEVIEGEKTGTNVLVGEHARANINKSQHKNNILWTWDVELDQK